MALIRSQKIRPFHFRVVRKIKGSRRYHANDQLLYGNNVFDPDELKDTLEEQI